MVEIQPSIHMLTIETPSSYSHCINQQMHLIEYKSYNNHNYHVVEVGAYD